MKNIFKYLLLAISLFVLTSCNNIKIDDPNGPITTDPYGTYDSTKLFSTSPYFVTQDTRIKDKKFEVILPKDHLENSRMYNSSIIDLIYVECDNLSELFSCHLSEEYLISNYKALYFIREEPIDTDVLEHILYSDLFIENGKIYVTVNYLRSGIGGEALSYYEDIILIPNEWVNSVLNLEINFNIKNHPYGYSHNIMSYTLMNEFKEAYINQILNNQYDDMLYREVSIVDAYGEYNGCLVATATYTGYIHDDRIIYVTESFINNKGIQIDIKYDIHYPIWVYKDNKLYTLTEAYDNKYLSIDDIESIYRYINYKQSLIHNHYYVNGSCSCGFNVLNSTCEYQWEKNRYGHLLIMKCNCCTSSVVTERHIDKDDNLYCDLCSIYLSDSPDEPTNHFLRNLAGMEWLNYINVQSIDKIKIIDEAVGVAPGSLKDIYTITDKDVINRLYESYYWMDTWPMTKEDGMISGGSAMTVKFILNSGEVKEIYINNGNYHDGCGNIFNLLYLPELKENDPYEKCFGFITYKKIAQIASYVEDCSIYIDTPCYVKNSPKLLVPRYEILVDDLEFIETDIIVEDIEPTKYFIKTEFGLLRFIDERTFYLVDRPEEMYFLVGKSLNELMDEGKAIN